MGWAGPQRALECMLHLVAHSVNNQTVTTKLDHVCNMSWAQDGLGHAQQWADMLGARLKHEHSETELPRNERARERPSIGMFILG